MSRYFKYLIIAILAACIFSAGCEKEDDFFGSVSVTNISVDAAYMNGPVTIEGTNLDMVQFVFVGERQAEFTLSGSSIMFDVPETAKVGTTEITLVMKKNYREKMPFEVLLRPVPVIQSVSATAVKSGDELTIKGLSFNSEYSPVVTVGGATASITANTGSELTVVVPQGLAANELAEIEITSIHGSTKSNFLFYAGENLVVNGSLDEGSGDDFTNWTKLNGGDGMTEVSGENAYFGRSIRIVGANNPGQPWRTQFATDPIAVKAGTEYTLILWAKGEANGAIMRISVSQYPEDYFYGADVNITNEWEQYSWTFTGQELPNGSRIVLDMGHTDVPFVIDNVTLVEGGGGSLGAPEILTNGSFEDDMTGWEALNGTFNISTSEAYCGSKSLEAVGTGGNHWDVQVAVAVDAAPTLEEGTLYELGFWAKAAGPDGVMRVSVSRYDGNGDDFFYSPDVTVAEDWTYYSYIFEAQTTNSGIHQVVMDFGSTTQTFNVDAVSLKEYVAPTSLFENGDFEDDLTGWEALNGSLEVTTDEAYEGSSSLMAVGTGGNHWDVQLAVAADAAPTLTAGELYKLSFWAKAGGPDGVMRASVSRYDGNGDDFFYSPGITVAEEWTYYSFVFEAKTTNSGVHQVVLDFGSTTQTFYVDNVVLSEYGDPCE